MTAVVGILNKKAVAIAADSAVTMGSGKIFNKANKIFTLSKYHPVGVAIHNAAEFMGTPWETIIKVYRQSINNNAFDKLEMYQINFIDFLYKNDFFCDEEQQKNSLFYFCQGIAAHLINRAAEEITYSDPQRIDKIQTQLKIKIKEHISLHSSNKDYLNDFKGYSFEDFINYTSPFFEEILEEPTKMQSVIGITIDNETKELFKKSFYHELIVKEFYTNTYTGLVFAGFGEKEIFPSLIHLHIYFGFDKKLRYFINEGKNSTITHTTTSDVCTFAQYDVIYTILRGIAPDLEEVYNNTFESFINIYEQGVKDKYLNDKGDLLFAMAQSDKKKLKDLFTQIMQGVINQKFVYPLFQTVAGLSKEDLAEMAESLIYLTYLQRRITNGQESVGGPVDVALLSKGDGFIWIKRKHYFSPELNPHFIKKYI